MGVRVPGDGLDVAEAFYDAGGVDTRERVRLVDVQLQFIMEGDPARVRAIAEEIATAFLYREDVSGAVCSVTER